jgi:hypothetical protein
LGLIRKASGTSLKIAVVFLVLGIFVLVCSVWYEMQILAFIGLGLVFWGAIFLVTRTGRFVESSLLDSTAKSTYSTIDRIINDLKFNGRGYYIPAYPQNAFIPDFLKNLRDSVVFISDESFVGLPSVEELASGKFLSERSRGVFIISPGSGLLNQIERQLKLDFTTLSVNESCSLLPKCMTEFFNLAKDMDLQFLDCDTVRLTASGILYESLYDVGSNLKSVGILGCPVVSAVACALAKSSGKTVVIREQKFLPKGLSVEAWFKFVQG